MNLKVHFKNVIAWSILIEVLLASLWIVQLLPSLAYRGALSCVLIGARAVLTAVEFMAARLLMKGEAAAPILARRVLLASACLMTLEVGFRLTPTNLDPTFKWWIVGSYWLYVLAAWLMLRSSLTAEERDVP